MHPQRTFVALNSHNTPTAGFVTDTEWTFPAGACESAIAQAVGKEHFASFDAERIAVTLLGDSIYTNPLMLGFAWQRGRIPLSQAALMRAMELNGVQVANNQAAFEWGRRCAHDLAAVQAVFKATQVIEFVKHPSLDEIVAKRVEFLTGYQNAAYAEHYQNFVRKVQSAETPVGGDLALTRAVAKYLFKLMAYKDEYEVARLHTDGAFRVKLDAMFEGDFKLKFHLAPPLLASRNEKGELQKSQFGPWMYRAFKLLAQFKGLRGGVLDIFGYTAERREERALILEYRQDIEGLLGTLGQTNRDLAVAFARVPEQIRGYGHVKARHLKSVRLEWQQLLVRYRQNCASADHAP
jgi:indolepyruvate ferredoxin oxidoreductase